MHFAQTPLPAPHDEEQIPHKQINVGKDYSDWLHDIPGKMMIDVVMNERVLHEQKGGIIF